MATDDGLVRTGRVRERWVEAIVRRRTFARVARPVFGTIVAAGLGLWLAAIPSRYRQLLDTAESIDATYAQQHGGASLPR